MSGQHFDRLLPTSLEMRKASLQQSWNRGREPVVDLTDYVHTPTVCRSLSVGMPMSYLPLVGTFG